MLKMRNSFCFSRIKKTSLLPEKCQISTSMNLLEFYTVTIQMKKTTKLGMSALLISLFALFVGKKLDDEVNKDDENQDRGVGPLD